MGKHFESWVNLNAGECTWATSWLWVNSWKASWVMSWIDLTLRDMSWSESRHLTNAQRRSTKFSEIPKKSTNFGEFPKKSTKLTESQNQKRSTNITDDLNHWVMTWFESIFQSFLSNESIRIKILDFFCVVSWFELQYTGSFMSHESIWIKVQKFISGRELIWIKSCKAIVSHELSRIKTFWDWGESNKKLSRTHVCTKWTSSPMCNTEKKLSNKEKKTFQTWKTKKTWMLLM